MEGLRRRPTAIGDRVIVLTRWRSWPRTADYFAQRRDEGKGDGEIRRMHERYEAREL